MDQPTSPTPLSEAATAMHDMFLELVSAGFTRSEALELVAKVLATGVAQAQMQEQAQVQEQVQDGDAD